MGGVRKLQDVDEVDEVKEIKEIKEVWEKRKGDTRIRAQSRRGGLYLAEMARWTVDETSRTGRSGHETRFCVWFVCCVSALLLAGTPKTR